MSMKKLFATTLLLAAAAAPSVFGQSADSSLSLRVAGGWNSWVLGSALSSSSTVSEFTAGGLSGSVDLLFGPKDGTQWGLGAAYLPMFKASVSGESASLQLYPLVAELYFNGTGAFYGDLGVGVAFMGATSNANQIDSSSSSSFAPSPGFLAKAGLGWNIPINSLMGIDLGADLYMPFTDFGFGTGTSPIVDIIVFSQFNLKFGLVFNL
jgi:hypothetical protein